MKLKKMIACILSLCMLATMAPVTALAETTVVEVATQEELQAAINDAANVGNIIKIKKGTYDVPSMKAGITLEGEVDENGEPAVLLEGYLTSTLEDLTLKNLHIKGSNAQRWAYAKGDLVFENVTFEATGVYALHFDGITAGTNLTYKDCTIIGWAAMGGTPASCVFDGCTIKGNGTYGVIRTYFDATIKNCTFDVDNVNTEDVYQDGIHAVEGATVTVDNCTNSNGNMIDILNKTSDSKIMLDGVNPYAVAEVDGEYYESLQEAIWEAENGATVTLLDSVNGEGIVIEKDVVIDLGGNTYNLIDNPVGSTGTKSQGFQILAGDDKADPYNVTIKNGEITVDAINADNKYFQMLINNYSDLTLDKVTLDGTNLTGAKYTLSNNNGDIVVTGESYIIEAEDGVAFDVYDYATGGYKGVKVTFDENFTGGVAGGFEVGGEVENEGDKANAKLQIAGGHFMVDPSAYVVAGKQAVETTENGFKYVVVDKEIASTDVETTVETPTATVEGADKVDDAAVEAAKDAVDTTALKTAGAATATSKETTDAAIDALADAGETIPEGKTVTIIVEPELKMEVKAASATEVKVEIKAVCDIKAQVGESGTPVDVADDQPMDMTGKGITVTIPLSQAFVEGLGDKTTVSVTHIKNDGTVLQHEATVDKAKHVATFVNDKGFSTFYVTADPAIVATENGIYGSLQEAIVASAPDGTVEILDNITVEKWIMISERLSIGNGNIITCVINGMTINGNGHTLTVNSIESAGNGNRLFYDATKLNINDLTIKYADGVGGGIGLKDGTINKVTFDGGVYGVMPQTGAVTIKDCTFKTNGTAIYFEEERDGLTVTGNTFNQHEDANVIMLRGDVQFTNNEIVSGRTVNVVSGEPVVTGNDFNDVRLKVYNAAEATINNNTINNLVFNDETETKSTFANNTMSDEANAALVAVDGENVMPEPEPEPTPSTTKKSTKKYSVSVDADEIENGSIKLSSSKVKKGATVTLTVTPDAGYELDKLVVLDKDGNEVELTDKGNGKFTFKMPRGGVEVDASFVEIEMAEVNDEKVIVLTIGEKMLLIDGEYVVNDVAPIIRGERTVLPIRVIAEALGATVTWNEADQTVTIVKDDTTMVIYIGQAFALVNGEPVQLDQPAFIENGRTYLPLRFIMENLGANVTWDGLTQKVTIVG